MQTFDLRETLIPFAFLLISNHFRQMKPGEALEVICDDHDLVEELQCLLTEATDASIRQEILSAAGPLIRIMLKKVEDHFQEVQTE